MSININHKKITIYSFFGEVGSSKCTLNKIVTVQYHKLMDYKCVCVKCVQQSGFEQLLQSGFH